MTGGEGKELFEAQRVPKQPGTRFSELILRKSWPCFVGRQHETLFSRITVPVVVVTIALTGLSYVVPQVPREDLPSQTLAELAQLPTANTAQVTSGTAVILSQR